MILTRTCGVKCFILFLLVNCLIIMEISAQKISGYNTLQEIAKLNNPKYYCNDLNTSGMPTDSAGKYDYISPIISLIQNKEILLKK